MKKLSIITMICASMVLIASCTSKNIKSPKENLSNDIDSLSYAIGMLQVNELISYLSVDSTYMEDFLRGFYESVAVQRDDAKQVNYIMGIQVGQRYGTQWLEQFAQQIFGNEAEERFDKDNYIAGFAAGATNNAVIMNVEKADEYAEAKLNELSAKKVEKEFAFNKVAGYTFLEENKTKEGVVALPSGLQYKVIKAGKGATPMLTDQVKVHYRGMLIDGTIFDSSHKSDKPDKNGEPAVFTVMGVIPGWTEALLKMPVGSKWMLYVPQELAYGDQQRGQLITPFSALVFEVELIEIDKQPARL